MARMTKEEWEAFCDERGVSVNTFTVVDPVCLDAVLKLARGPYQRALVNGIDSWSGSTLSGKAKDWCLSYRTSRESLRARICAHGFHTRFAITHTGRMVLVVEESEPRRSWRAMGLDEKEILKLVKVTMRLEHGGRR